MVSEEPWSRECHPSLRGRRRIESYSHGLSSYQMESLSAICESFIPSIPSEDTLHVGGKEVPSRKAVQAFFNASASQKPIPDEVAPEHVGLVRIVLWLLSTRLGILLLCGTLCLGWEWPFIHKFSEMSLQKREVVLKNWSTARFLVPLRGVFQLIKAFCFFTFFSRTDENQKTQIGMQWDTIKRPKGLKVTEDPQQNLYNIKCDVVIVGSGCGGGVAAGVLASTGQKVIILDKGNYFVPEDYSSLAAPSMDQQYENGGFVTTVDGGLTIFAGSTVGGGSAVNWSASIKTPSSVLKEWAADHKLPLFGSSDYLSAMDTVLAGSVSQRLVKRKDSRIKSSVRGDKKGTQVTWLVDAVDHGAVILSACKAKRFILETNSELDQGKKMKCLGVMATSLNTNIRKELCIKAKNQSSDLQGKSYEGGIITSLNKEMAENSCVRYIIETPAVGPGSFSALMPWVSGHDMKERLVKYARTCSIFALVRDQGSGEVKAEGKINYKPSQLDKDNLTAGLRQCLRILISAGVVEVGTFRNDGQRIKCKWIKEDELEEFLDSVAAVEMLWRGKRIGIHTCVPIRWGVVGWVLIQKKEQLMRMVRIGKHRAYLYVMEVFYLLQLESIP
ncbi:hypothetical protein NE237_014556 [Protea cynaroides]|uniref:Long-chain-alcohol oxidase n=1 Tax=Protea cynaroides TaxID=273540 RepID=A0A9Q0QQ36_9MAGN|nr:hypothetical protein NE237_014556 [Protea cynaroides]